MSNKTDIILIKAADWQDFFEKHNGFAARDYGGYILAVHLRGDKQIGDVFEVDVDGYEAFVDGEKLDADDPLAEWATGYTGDEIAAMDEEADYARAVGEYAYNGVSQRDFA